MKCFEQKKKMTKFDLFYDWATNPENKKEYYDSDEFRQKDFIKIEKEYLKLYHKIIKDKSLTEKQKRSILLNFLESKGV